MIKGKRSISQYFNWEGSSIEQKIASTTMQRRKCQEVIYGIIASPVPTAPVAARVLATVVSNSGSIPR
jgi:hypothetical protein